MRLPLWHQAIMKQVSKQRGLSCWDPKHYRNCPFSFYHIVSSPFPDIDFLTINGDGTFLVGGDFQTYALTLGPSTVVNSNYDGRVGWVARMTADGVIQWGVGQSGRSTVLAIAAVVTSNGRIWCTGEFDRIFLYGNNQYLLPTGSPTAFVAEIQVRRASIDEMNKNGTDETEMGCTPIGAAFCRGSTSLAPLPYHPFLLLLCAGTTRLAPSSPPTPQR